MVWKQEGVSVGLHPPARPAGPKGYGTSGRPIKLLVNHFPITMSKPNLELFHFDVTIKNDKGNDRIPKNVKRQIFNRMKQEFDSTFKNFLLAFDGEKNAYSVSSKKGIEKPFEVHLEDESRNPNANKFFVTLKKVGSARLSDLLASIKVDGQHKDILTNPLQMLEVMFRECRTQKFLAIGRNSFFSVEDESLRCDIGGGKWGCKGFFATLRPATWKNGSILLNFDVTNTAIYKPQHLIDFMQETMRFDRRFLSNCLNQKTIRELKTHVKGLKVRTTHNHRTARCVGVSPQGADRLTFLKDDNDPSSKISVAAYYKEMYKINLQFPRLNCLHVGNPQRNIYIPIELCSIAGGQRVMKKLSDMETQTFIKSTAVPPKQRLETIRRMFEQNEFSTDPFLKAMGCTVAGRPLAINGRVLNQPKVTNRSVITPKDGAWDYQFSGFKQPAILDSWIVLNYDNRTDPGPFLNMLTKNARDKGMTMQDPLSVGGANPRNIKGEFANIKRKHPQIQLILCVLPFADTKTVYSNIKNAGDRETSIITQCVRWKNVQRPNPATINNLLLKINAKMGGTNNSAAANPSINVFSEPVIIMGADVNHPPAGGDSSIPSIAAVVASMDPFATKYATEIRAQEHRVEYIADLTEITMNLLKAFFSRNRGMKPTRIIMYRDGVSESQFSAVLASEMIKMRKACTKLDPAYKPPITFMCVQKRHHTRLFPDNPRDACGRMGNVPPGTVVDRQITHPHELDFFLVSHQGIQGTSRPSHYHLLWDDSDLPIETLQLLTYMLCHVYSRCNKSVSIPCPVYYAHLAAFRAKTYLTTLEHDDSSSTSARTLLEMKRLSRFSSDRVLSGKLFYI